MCTFYLCASYFIHYYDWVFGDPIILASATNISYSLQPTIEAGSPSYFFQQIVGPRMLQSCLIFVAQQTDWQFCWFIRSTSHTKKFKHSTRTPLFLRGKDYPRHNTRQDHLFLFLLPLVCFFV